MSASTPLIRVVCLRAPRTRFPSARLPIRPTRPLASDSVRSHSELRLSQDSLRQISEESGGFAAVNRNDTASVFDRIVRDNSSYYVLAYYPPTNKTDGKFHRIDVKVTRPGLVVRARRGYAAPKGKPSTRNTKTGGMPPEMFEAINSPLQVSGLTMRVFVAPFKGSATQRVGAGWRRIERPRFEPGREQQG